VLNGFFSTALESVESRTQADPQWNMILYNMGVYISANSTGANSTAGIRINTANGTLAASITASTTGYFEDNVNSDRAPGNGGTTVNYYLTVPSGGGSITPNVLAVRADHQLPLRRRLPIIMAWRVPDGR
jgi:hypothetical protein